MVAISVIMACYNAADYVGRAIASLQAQTLSDWELCAVDDASSDTTVEMLRQFAARDPRISVQILESNGGPGVARNRALCSAQGRWVTVLDADDAYEPSRLERLIDRSDDYDMIFDNLLLWDEKAEQATGTGIPVDGCGERPFTAQDLIESESPSASFRYGFFKPAIRLSFLSRHGLQYDTRLRLAEDFDLYARCLLRGARAKILMDPMYIYTTQVGAASGARAGGTRTVFDPYVRLELAQRLFDDFKESASPDQMRLLRQYGKWQRIYTDVCHLSVHRKSWNLLEFGKTAFNNPYALKHYVSTSRLARRLKAII